MTTFRKERRICCVCGNSGHFDILTSTNFMGPSDLDTRPSEMARSTIGMWIQRCPACGYCAPDVSEGSPQARQIVGSAPYLRQRDAPEYPTLANRFLCWAILQATEGHYSEAGWAAIHAAWACDDARAEQAATACRKRAVELLRRARARRIPFQEERAAEEAILADLLRRSGHFAQAQAFCRIGLAKRPAHIVRRVLRFEGRLAAARDRRCYTVGEMSTLGRTLAVLRALL